MLVILMAAMHLGMVASIPVLVQVWILSQLALGRVLSDTIVV